MATAPRHGPLETMHAAFRNPRLVGNTSHTLLAVVTKTFDNAKTSVPKSHVGLFSEKGLNSWWNSVLQRT